MQPLVTGKTNSGWVCIELFSPVPPGCGPALRGGSGQMRQCSLHVMSHHVRDVGGEEEEKGRGPSKKEGRGLPKEEEGQVHESVNKVEETMKGKMGKRSRDSSGEEVQKVLQEEEEEGGEERHREVKRTEEEKEEDEEPLRIGRGKRRT